jgi:hypothetical protein
MKVRAEYIRNVNICPDIFSATVITVLKWQGAVAAAMPDLEYIVLNTETGV